MDESVIQMTAREFVSAVVSAPHVEIMLMDTSPLEFVSSVIACEVRSLEMSRLELSNEFLYDFNHSNVFPNLRWLDLSANPRITYAGVQALTLGVQRGKFPSLRWLELFATECDATPYIDGQYWRMTKRGKELAARYGHQPWMMLGSRNPKMEGCELLYDAQLNIPPDRFTI